MRLVEQVAARLRAAAQGLVDGRFPVGMKRVQLCGQRIVETGLDGQVEDADEALVVVEPFLARVTQQPPSQAQQRPGLLVVGRHLAGRLGLHGRLLGAACGQQAVRRVAAHVHVIGRQSQRASVRVDALGVAREQAQGLAQAVPVTRCFS